jgi:cell division protein ZipA
VEASTLRWILVIAGVIVIGIVWMLSTREKNTKPKATRRSKEKKRGGKAERREPTLDGSGASPDGEAMEGVEPGGQGELAIGEEPRIEPELKPKPRPRQAPLGPPPDRIVSLFLLARDNHVITGAELLQATVSTGMEFGDMNIFHRLPEGEEKPVFSLANAAKPGHFERDEWNTFETTGVVLFMTLPGPMHALDGWDSMLATARRVGEILQADLLDEQRSPFSRQREAQIREEMREYDRKKNPAT